MTTTTPPDIAAQRRDAAAGITRLMETHEAFSLVRLGDGETWWLLEVQAGKPPPKYRYAEDKGASVELVRSVSGLEPRHLDRFVESLEQATYLDYCNSLATVARDLPRVKMTRNPDLFKNESAETSNIIFEWTYYEMRDYLARHRCLFAGAEASLMRELWADPRYRRIASPWLAENSPIFFHQVRDNGRHYSENLDLIKEDLRREITANRIDTLFLSLATGAKILVYELAREMNIKAIDFGSMPRALCYAGSPGYQSNRSLHNPFMFRVPLEVFAEALTRAMADLPLPALISRLHAQMLLELQPHRLLTFNPADVCQGQTVDISAENLRHFRESVRIYNQRYRPLALRDPDARGLHRDFRRWCLKKGLGFQGKIFVSLVKAKGWWRQAVQVLTGRKTGASVNP